jgi:hypothetical protein
MAFGFGCLTSAVLMAPVAGLLLIIVWFPPLALAYAALVATLQISIGLALGLGVRRWGYLQGVGFAVVALSATVGVLLCILRVAF